MYLRCLRRGSRILIQTIKKCGFRIFAFCKSLSNYKLHLISISSAVSFILLQNVSPIQPTIGTIRYPTSPLQPTLPYPGLPTVGFPTTSVYPSVTVNPGTVTQPVTPTITQPTITSPYQPTQTTTQRFPTIDPNTPGLPPYTLDNNGYPPYINSNRFPDYNPNDPIYSQNRITPTTITTPVNPYLPVNPVYPGVPVNPVNPTVVNPNTNTVFPGTTTNPGVVQPVQPVQPINPIDVNTRGIQSGNFQVDPITGLRYLEDPATQVWMFVDNSGIPYSVQVHKHSLFLEKCQCKKKMSPGKKFVNSWPRIEN